MFSFLKPDPVKKLTKAYEAKLQQAMQAQRSGDIEGYSRLTKEAEQVRAELDQLDAQAKT